MTLAMTQTTTRQLKFQAFDEQTGQMSEPFSLGDSWIRWLFSDGEQSQGVLVEELKSVRLTIRQFTGLTDKDGVEIYEGDILEHPCFYETPEMSANPPEYSVVIFKDGCFTFNGAELLHYELAAYDWQMSVVGNIYQHPTLIEER